MAERSSKSAMGLPANSSTVALMRKSDKQSGGLEVEFRGGERSSHATTGQYITVAILFYVNLINYMDRMTIAGKHNIVKQSGWVMCHVVLVVVVVVVSCLESGVSTADTTVVTST